MGIIGADGAKPHVLFVDRQGNQHYDRAWKQQVVAAALEPDASLSRVALDHGINSNLVRKWVRKHKDAQIEAVSPSLSAAFIPVRIEAAADNIVSRHNAQPLDLKVRNSGAMQQAPVKATPFSSPAKLNVTLPNGVMEMIIDLHVVMSKSTYAQVLPQHYLDNELPLEKRELWEKRFAGPTADQLIFVAKQGQEIAGFCCFVFNEEKEHGSCLHNLYVSQAHQRRGIAKSLLNQAIKAFDSERKKLPVHLLVFVKNTNAVAIYEKLGGAVIEKREVSRWGNPAVVLLRYQWPSADVLLPKLNNPHSQKTDLHKDGASKLPLTGKEQWWQFN